MASPPTIEVLSSTRVHPSTPQSTPTTTRLSIIDASVARFTPCGAIWFFPSPSLLPSSPAPSIAFSPSALKASLAHTLTSYPQWTGHLHMIPYVPNLPSRAYTQRYGRLGVHYGSPTDPGVAFVSAHISCTLASALPFHGPRENTTPTRKLYNCDAMLREDVLLPRTPLAGYTSPASHDDVSVAVQVTQFTCGGAAVGVKIAHCLADATALSQFMRDWSAVHAALISNSPLPEIHPVFEPWTLDQRATRDLDETVPDEEVLKAAYALPAHRYDWWASAEGSGFGPGAHAIPEVLREEPATREIAVEGEKMPWGTYDVPAPVSHTLIHYTAAQLDKIGAAASTPGPEDTREVNISRHDALVAQIWTLINRARWPENGDASKAVHANITFGLRTRVSPPLSPSFLGSPLQIAKVTLPWSVASSSTALPSIASSIKRTLNVFTPAAIAAQIYAIAHELSPQRLWQAFLGREHMLVTSWAHTGLYTCDFGTGGAPQYVHPIMPLVDGCVQIIEGAPIGPITEGKKWYEDGVDVAIYLEREAMARLVKDERIWL
ncbi:hypothetical protein BU23DRAFT_211572 [Bimuria novae-zelandiae CBS 107.79]|uniref:Transferase family protein n=1 Tax=Bimuria novae-zelandiae CBS 107.79 TaxID=1447943 RepID=A0A6A5UZX0_9PLEO|nr:hypothetical protein BU23DRAFT_211572 [Bimuria novae-zelandiae CBS 107.79]